MNGRSLELYFVDGHPDGMLTAEVFNWTGHALRIPRTRLADGLQRPAARQTGVYILIGDDPDGALCYIGESEDMSIRLKQHAREKDWWDQAILITTTGDALHKAHVKYLESRLAETALETAASRLENGNAPPKSSLNEAATANMESFLETLHMVLPAIRVDVFRSGRRASEKESATQTAQSQDVAFEFKVDRHNVHAHAVLRGDEMIVLKGSKVRSNWIGDRKHNAHYWKIHDTLAATGVIACENGSGEFTEDYSFSSPSAAAAIASGRSANGRTSWRLKNGDTYAQWEAKMLNEAT
jgi:hypothetical protein